MKKLVFVYGTLKKNYSNHRCLGDSKLLGEAETPAEYTLYDGGFPIVERGGKTSIKGEIYEVTDPSVLKRVYGLEGYSGTPTSEGGHNWYDTDKLSTEFGMAEIFVQDQNKSGRSSVVSSGVWKR